MQTRRWSRPISGCSSAARRYVGYMPGAQSCCEGRSGTGCDGAAVSPELIVDTDRDDVDLLVDAVEHTTEHWTRNREGVVRAAHEEGIVVEADRPSWRQEPLKPSPCTGAPTGRTDRCQTDPRSRVAQGERAARYRPTALYVKQGLVRSIAD